MYTDIKNECMCRVLLPPCLSVIPAETILIFLSSLKPNEHTYITLNGEFHLWRKEGRGGGDNRSRACPYASRATIAPRHVLLPLQPPAVEKNKDNIMYTSFREPLCDASLYPKGSPHSELALPAA